MGNIAFNIFKDVDLNKTVDLEINKNVNVNVNIDDQLATAEADAEAFGSPALAEVDAYTFVTETEAFAYAESTSALDLEAEDTTEVFFIEGTFGEGANIFSGGSFTGSFIEEPSFPNTGSGSIQEFDLAFFDSAGNLLNTYQCFAPVDIDCSDPEHIIFTTDPTRSSWLFELPLVAPSIGEGEPLQEGELIFTFDSILGSNEFDFVEGTLITSDDLGEPLEITSASLTSFQDDQLGSIGNQIFFDGNGDGINNDGMGGVAGVEVELRGPVSKTTTTNSEGLYFFDNLLPGTYQVTFDISDIDFDGSSIGAFTEGPDSQVSLRAFRQIATAENINLAPGEENLNIDAGVEVFINLPPQKGTGGLAIVGENVPFTENQTITIEFQDTADVTPLQDLKDIYPIGNIVTIDDLVLERNSVDSLYTVNNSSTPGALVNYGPVSLRVDYDGNPATTNDQEDIINKDLFLVIPNGTKFKTKGQLGQGPETIISYVDLFDTGAPYVTFAPDPFSANAKRIEAPQLTTNIGIKSTVFPDAFEDSFAKYSIDWFASGDHFAPLM